MLVTSTPTDKFGMEKNFWIENPQFQIARPFKDVHKMDKSKDKSKSSILMWFVALSVDSRSIWKNIPEEDKFKILSEDFCGSKTYYDDNKDLIHECTDAYVNMQYTPAKRALLEWEKKMTQRARFINDSPYTFDRFEEDEEGKIKKIAGNALQLDTLMKNTADLYKDYERIKKQIADEEQTGVAKGGKMLSLSDMGEI